MGIMVFVIIWEKYLLLFIITQLYLRVKVKLLLIENCFEERFVKMLKTFMTSVTSY